MIWGGPCPPIYIRGDRVTWKVLAQYSWSPTITQSGSFLCTTASSTPIRVVTIEVRYINELSLTLEHSMPISSPAARVWHTPHGTRYEFAEVDWIGCLYSQPHYISSWCRVLWHVSQHLNLQFPKNSNGRMSLLKLWKYAALLFFLSWCMIF